MDAIDNYLEEQVENLSEVENLEDFYDQCFFKFECENDIREAWEALMEALAETPFEVQKKFWDSFLSQRSDKVTSASDA